MSDATQNRANKKGDMHHMLEAPGIKQRTKRHRLSEKAERRSELGH